LAKQPLTDSDVLSATGYTLASLTTPLTWVAELHALVAAVPHHCAVALKYRNQDLRCASLVPPQHHVRRTAPCSSNAASAGHPHTYPHTPNNALDTSKGGPRRHDQYCLVTPE